MSENHPARPTYTGSERSMVISFDFGTTYSGISYAVLEPGFPPKVRSVTGYPGQEDIASSTKVPSVIYYDGDGDVRAIGAETNDPDRMSAEGFEDWVKLDWFKFLLRPKSLQFSEPDAPSPKLPPGKTITAVLADLFKYLNGCVASYIQRTHAEGQALWEGTREKLNYVLSHPNGWDGFQQGIMRNAAIAAGMVPDSDDGRSRIQFVSEGEASLHWCVDCGLAGGALKLGTNIVVADCGGGTIDVSAFRVVEEIPLRLEETKPASCRLAGAVYVTRAFDRYIREYLKDSAWGDPETIERLSSSFENRSKKLFRQDSQNVSIPFGGPRETDIKYGIRAGKLTFSKDTMAKFFERSCNAVEDSIKRGIEGNSGKTIVFLVGGFAASPYLLSEVERRLEGYNVWAIKRAESHTAKAVADGAVCFYLDRYISARIAKHTYGVYGNPIYNPHDPEHARRSHKVFIEASSGRRLVAGGFFPHVIKGTAVRETTVSRLNFSDTVSTRKAFQAKFTLYCYKGDKPDIRWTDDDINGFQPLCSFTAQVNKNCLVKGTTANGDVYWRANYAAVVTFGATEFACRIEWKNEQGDLQRGPMKAVWDEG